MSTLKKEVAFIDVNVSDLDQLIAGLRSEVEPIVLRADQSAARQMAQALAGMSGLNAVHVIAHGRSGEIVFAGGGLSCATLGEHARDLAALRRSLADDATIQLYSCHVAQGEAGQGFVRELGGLLGADVFASAETVGAAELNGDWILDWTTSKNDRAASLPLMPETTRQYRHVLGISIFLAPAFDTGSSSNDGITKLTGLTISGTGGMPLNYVIFTIGSTTYSPVLVGGGGIFAFIPPVLVEGSYTITAQEWNSALTAPVGGSSASTIVVVDTTAPASSGNPPDLDAAFDSGSSNSDDITKLDSGLVFNGSGVEALATVKLYDTGGTTLLGTAQANSSGEWSITSSQLSEGGHTLTVKQTDRAGNASTIASSSLTITVDKTAPTTTISSIDIDSDTGSPDSDFITNTASQTITATLSAALATGEVLWGSVDAGTNWTDITSKALGTDVSWDGATLAGNSSIWLKVMDAAGNDGAVASQIYSLDTTADANNDLAVTITDGDGYIANSEKAAVAFSVAGLDADATAVVSFNDGSNTVTANVSGNGAQTAVDLSSLADGPIASSITASDTAGNNANGASDSSSKDTTADTAPTATLVVGGGAGPNVANAMVSFVVDGLDLDVAMAQVTFWDSASNTVTVNASAGQANISGLSGTITSTLNITDTAGNTITINGNTVYDTIQAAINAATAGDIIRISEGTYTENVRGGPVCLDSKSSSISGALPVPVG